METGPYSWSQGYTVRIFGPAYNPKTVPPPANGPAFDIKVRVRDRVRDRVRVRVRVIHLQQTGPLSIFGYNLFVKVKQPLNNRLVNIKYTLKNL